MQLLDEAFKILDSDDVKRLFGADNAWDVVEEVLIRYFNERLVTSPRQRMGVTGREVLRWLAQPHILQTTRGAVRGAAARDRRARRRVAHQRPGHGPGAADRQRPGDALDAVQSDSNGCQWQAGDQCSPARAGPLACHGVCTTSIEAGAWKWTTCWKVRPPAL